MKKLYYIAILPHEDVCREILLLKEDIRNRFHISWAMRSPAHITLFSPFHLDTGEVPILRRILEDFSYRTFPIDLWGFGHFGERVIYISVTNHTPIRRLREALDWELGGFQIKSRIKKFHPHITLMVRDVTPEIFHRAWDHFKDIPYSRRIFSWRIALFEHSPEGWTPLPQDFKKEVDSNDR